MSKILLVEDNDINRDMLSRRLERQGFEVIVAVNGAEGVTKTQSDRPDLVLMDMHLPILDGWEATRKIKANPQTRMIPVIALTADALLGEREKALAAGCDEYDTKPVNFPRLLEKMSMLLEPAASQPASSPPEVSSPFDQRLQRILRTRLRRELEPPIHRIISYSDMILDMLSGQPNLIGDLQKIHNSGMQLLRLIHAILNPVLVEIQQQEIDLLARAVRLELLTPLSTIIGYCEMLLEESPADLVPDLKQIYASAEELLNQVNCLDSLVNQHVQSIHAVNSHETNAVELMLESATIQASRRRAETHRRSPQDHDSRILVVDDNASNSTLLSHHLERQGYQVTIATTGQQALEAIAAIAYDLILLDISLPEIRGLKVLEQLKCHGEWRHIPVLITAAFDELEPVTQSIAMGAADYLTRPFQSVLLRAKVTACLEQKRLRNQNGNFDGFWKDAPVGVYQATIEGRFRGVNSTLVQLLGYPAAETLMDTIANIGDQIYVDRNRYTEFKRLLEENNQVTGFEYQAYRHDGDIIWVSEHARAVRDTSGQIVYYEGIVEEITQRRLAETALHQQLEALQHELEQIKYAQQAAEIAQTDYFQQLQSRGEVQQNVHPQPILPPKVLLVEDNELNCDMLSRRLQRYGYEVVIASDGADGISKALSEQPQVILMDISLPVMDGWEATQQLKGNSQTSNIPVIALTAHAMTGDREKALAAGCDDYDTKPINLSRLLSKIEDCLKRSTVQ